MKKIPLILLTASLAATQFTRAQTTIFNDTFSSSTTNGISTPGGTPTASSTSYDLASTKDGRTCSIVPGKFQVKLAGGTTAGFIEAQAIFASTPVQLVNVGDSITLTIAFTNTAGTLIIGGSGSVIAAGLYYSGSPSALPVGASPWLVNAGLGAGTTFINGNCQNWQGYASQLSSNTLVSKVFTRTNQSAANNANQDLLFSGSGTGLYNTPGGTQLGVNANSGLTLTSGAKYTLNFTILLSAAGTVSVTNSLFDVNGTLLTTYGGTSSGGASYLNNGNYFDGLAFGLANKGTSFNPTIDISQITITKNAYVAPVITGLTNRTVVAGTSPTLAPTVSANPSAAYQWRTNGVNIGGATSATLTLNNVQYAQDGWVYSLIATNVMGAVTNSMTLSVIVTPSITGLNNQAVYIGSTANINATVNGVPAAALQWQLNGTNLTDGVNVNGATIAGSTTAALSIANAQAADTGTYSLVASNSAGTVTNSMYLLVSASNVAPTLVGPNNLTVSQGNNGTFSISSYYGLPQPVLQWVDQNGAPILNATNTTLTLANILFSQNGYLYSCVASNSAGSVTNSATLTVIVPPAISAQPSNLAVNNTQPALFSVTASGVPAPAYQWYFNNAPISGATSSTYNIASAAPANMGNYKVVITNVAGAITSSVVTLTVNSTMAATTLSPANGASAICYDTPLAITFSVAPSIGTNGTIKIYNVTNSATPVDTINIGLGAVQQRTFSGDGQSFSYQTIQISGNTAKIYPHFSVLSPNATYYVTIDNGAFTDAAGAYFVGITATNVWLFNTKVSGPADPANPIVNGDGSADFLTVQGAVNSLAAGTNATQRVISIRNGLYTEIVDIAGKHNVTLRGQSRTGSVIAFPNNATFQAVNGGSTHARMTFKVNANDIVLDTLAVSNSTPQGGSQAEAMMIESSAKRCIVYNSELDGRQDTILANVNSSQAYFYKTLVKGNFDYIWGGGNLYFDQCTIQTISGASGYNLTAARTDTSATISTNFPWANPGGSFSANGMSFVNCTFTADSGVGTVTLAGSNGSAGNNVSWYGCDFATNYIAPSASLFSGNFVLWQDLNTTNNIPVTYTVVTSISGNDARLFAATNIPTWFYGWTPSIVPSIVTNPLSQTVTAGQSASFGVLATGIPTPTYQWQHAGTNLPSAISATLNLASATMDTAGNYAVMVTTPAGSVTSSTATLTVNTLSITVTPNGQIKVYGNLDPALTYTYAPVLLSGDSFSGALDRVAGNNVGSYAITQGTLSLNANYAINFIGTSNLVITPAALSITASNVNKVIGQTIIFAGTEFSSTGLVPSDSVTSVALSSTGAGAGAGVGSYSIIPSAAVGSGLGNYTITYNNGTLSVTGSPNSAFTSIIANNGGSVTMTFSGSNGLAYRIQATANLSNPSWTDVSTNTVSGGVASFTDTNTSGLTKFYRVVYP